MGECFGEHDFAGHGGDNFYEELIHIPLLIFNLESEGVVKEPVGLVNLWNWLVQSKSSMNDQTIKGDDWVVSKTYDEEWFGVAIRTKRWKYIYRPGGEDEMFNLEKDSKERKNVIGDYIELANALRAVAIKEVNTDKEKHRLKKKTSKINSLFRK